MVVLGLLLAWIIHKFSARASASFAVMAFWNVPIDIENHSAKASMAALDILDNVRQLNSELADEFYQNSATSELGKKPPHVRVGIGFNRGACCVGNLGSLERFDYSAIGDSVNIASRVETLTKTYDVDILVTKSVVTAAPQFAFLEVDDVKVKGRQGLVRIYALVGNEDVAKSDRFGQLKEWHRKMITAYKASDMKTARALLQDCTQVEFEGLDGVYAHYQRRLASHEELLD